MERKEAGSGSLSLTEEAARQEKYWKKNCLWALLLAVVFFLIWLVSGPKLEIVPGQEALQVQTPDFAVEIPYTAVTAVELVTVPDYGSCLSGQSNGDVLYGLWKNAAWGEYQLGVYSGGAACVVVTWEQGVVAVNFAAEDETQALYAYMQAQCGDSAASNP